MPVCSNSRRKSFIPDILKKVPIFHRFYKTTPYYERRKSSPNLPEKESTKVVSVLVDNNSMSKQKLRISNSSDKKIRRSSSKFSKTSKDKVSNLLKVEREPKEKFSYLKNLLKKDRSKSYQDKIVRRQSEQYQNTKTISNKPGRSSFTSRKSHISQGNNIKLTPKEGDLALICQLLLIRSITPKTTENPDLTDQFNMRLDENYFEYYPYVFKYMCDREQAVIFNRNYLKGNEFTENFRCTLVDWLIKVQLYSKISTETLQVAVILVDMFTSLCQIKRSFYQLVGLAGLLIACKVVQRYHPRIKELCFLTKDCYIPAHVVQMERIMLEKMNFFVNVPIPMHFCHRGLLACVEIVDTDQMELFCNFLFDIILMHPDSPGIRSSCKSAAAIFIARFIFYSNYPPWTKILQHYTLYRLDQLKDCVLLYLEMMDKLYESNRYGYRTVLEKYSMPIRKSIAKNETFIKFATNPEAKQKLKNIF